MADRKCSHHRKVTGVVQCDLSRTDGRNSVYSSQFNVTICAECGHTEIYCESHKSVCEWLANKSARNSRGVKASLSSTH